MMLQGTPEWEAARLGKVGASRVSDVVAKIKTGWGASRYNYMAELVAERLTGTRGDKFTSPSMVWGTDNESDARLAYEFRMGTVVEQVGFIDHPTIAMSGASPDGLIGTEGMVEFKCPNTATHLDTLLGGSIPDKYIVQMQWQMACKPERRWNDFVSFDPRMPESMRLFIKRVQRDNNRIAELERDVTEFLDEIEKKLAALNARYGDGVPVLRNALEQSALMAG